MSGFLSKIRTLTLGTAHDLLDKAIDLNSPSMVRQYVRDLEDALDKMHNEAAIQAGQVRTLERELGDLKHNIETETELARKIVNGTAPNKDQIARAKAQQILEWKQSVPRKEEALEAQRKASQDIDTAVRNLESKHSQMVSRVRDLERMDRDSKVKEQAARSLESAGKLVSTGSSVSIDDIESKMAARNDVAQEKFSRAMNSVAVEEDPTQAAQVDDLLNSLKS